MKTRMVNQDAETFVALGRAVALARAERAVDAPTAADLTAALAAGILAGCMDMSTYGRVHDALAALLEKAFEGPVREVGPSPFPGGEEEPLGAYLEVVGEAWDKVSWDEGACGDLKAFAARSLDLRRARFGGGAWLRAPLKKDVAQLLRAAKAAGLLVVAVEGAAPAGPLEAALRPPAGPAGAARVVLGWGDRKTALDLSPLPAGD